MVKKLCLLIICISGLAGTAKSAQKYNPATGKLDLTGSNSSSTGGDNLGNHIATKTITAGYGISATTGVFSSSLTVTGLLLGTTVQLTSGTFSGGLTVSSLSGVGKLTGGILSASKVSLSTEVTGILPVGNGGTGTSVQFTSGSVVFASTSGVYNQDSANLFWNDSLNRFGINVSSIPQALSVEGQISLNRGTYIVVVGKDSGRGFVGSNTTLIGGNIGGSGSIASNSVVVGAGAVPNGVSDFNVVVGAGAGSSIGANTSCTLVGYGSNIVSNGSIAGATAIGAGAIAKFSNTMILGNGSVDVGIGVSDPRATLELAAVSDLGSNVVVNSTFEVDTSNWTGDGATLAVGVGVGPSFDNSLEITNTANPGFAYQEFPTNPRRRYAFTLQYGTGSNFYGQVIITSDGDTAYDSGVLYIDEQWQTLSGQFITNGTDTSVIELYNVGDPGSTFLYDNITIQEIVGGDLIANGDIASRSLTASSLTSGRVPLVTTDGLLADSSQVTYNTNTEVLTISSVAVGGLGSVRIGTSTTFGVIGGSLYFAANSSANAAAFDTTFYTTSLSTGSLARAGDCISYDYAGSFATSLATDKRVKVKFGATTVCDSGNLAITSASDWTLSGSICRISQSSQKNMCSLNTSFASLGAYADSSTSTENLGTTLDLKLTGSGTNASDVTAQMGKGRFDPGP